MLVFTQRYYGDRYHNTPLKSEAWLCKMEQSPLGTGRKEPFNFCDSSCEDFGWKTHRYCVKIT